MSLSSVLYTLQVVSSIYGVYLSYQSISSLRKHEEKSEKAAKWSNTAEHQLYKTRITQASGLGAVSFSLLLLLGCFAITGFQGGCLTQYWHPVPNQILLSLLTSLYFLISSAFSEISASSPLEVLLNILNLAVTLSAYFHVAEFWRRKAKIPFVEGFNDGITRTHQIRQILCVLAALFAINGFIQVLGRSWRELYSITKEVYNHKSS